MPLSSSVTHSCNGIDRQPPIHPIDLPGPPNNKHQLAVDEMALS